MRIVACIALAVLAAGCSKAPEKPKAEAPAGAGPAASADAPPEQLALVAAIEKGSDDPAFCAEFQKTSTFNDWVVTVSDFSTSTINGSIDIVLDAGPHVRLEQVIQTNDAAYPSVEVLRMGHKVRMSGRFTHGNAECGYQLRTVNVAITRAKAVG